MIILKKPIIQIILKNCKYIIFIIIFQKAYYQIFFSKIK